MRASRAGTVLFVFVSALLASCAEGALRKAADPPATPPLPPRVGWAVIDAAYAQVFDIPSTQGVVLGYYRRGTVVSVIERRIEQGSEASRVWLLNEGEERGWIRESDAVLYDSPEKAATAAAAAGGA